MNIELHRQTYRQLLFTTERQGDILLFAWFVVNLALPSGDVAFFFKLHPEVNPRIAIDRSAIVVFTMFFSSHSCVSMLITSSSLPPAFHSSTARSSNVSRRSVPLFIG